jgi:hypothetical protein
MIKKESVLNYMEVPGKYETTSLIITNSKFYYRVNLGISYDPKYKNRDYFSKQYQLFMQRWRRLFSMSNLHFNTLKLLFMQGALLCGGYADEAMGLVTEGRWFHCVVVMLTRLWV